MNDVAGRGALILCLNSQIGKDIQTILIAWLSWVTICHTNSLSLLSILASSRVRIKFSCSVDPSSMHAHVCTTKVVY